MSYAEKREREKRVMRTEKEEAAGKLTRSPCLTRLPAAVAAEYVFTSAHGALKFATNYVHGQLKRSALARARDGEGDEGRGLGGLDGAAQAGMICAELMWLSPVWRNVLIARFTVPSMPCTCGAQCCRLYRENPDWSAAVDQLTEFVLHAGLTGTISHHRMRRALVTRYFGRKGSFVEIAQSCGVHRTTASEYNKAVVECFRDIERWAFEALELRLQEAGIVLA